VRIAVISPFLDRGHGTERCVIEQLERLPPDAVTEIHIYAQRVEDLRAVVRYEFGRTAQIQGRLVWHKVASIPGPHLLRYLFWFFANIVTRRWHAKYRGLRYDLVYSPGINATDANAITVHIVFHEFYRQVIAELSFGKTPFTGWPRLLHRRLYYRLIMALEKKIYKNPRASLAAVSSLVAKQLETHFHRTDVRVIRNGVDAELFSPSRKAARRSSEREKFGLSRDEFTLLLIGNDWKKKGLDAFLRALADICELSWELLIVGSDDRGPYERVLREYGIVDRVCFLAPSPDVVQFYAAADAYVGPSLEDAYGLPVLEAMACGLPVISSSRAGVSDVIRNGINGILLSDPSDARELASALRSLITNSSLCQQLGEQASLAARNETWSHNAQATWKWLNEVLLEKRSRQNVKIAEARREFSPRS
jgi:glycosyltransferase involved in cell wall biosynthesis